MVRVANEGRVHSWTVCYFAAQEFLKEVPFTLVLVEFAGVDTLFLSSWLVVEREEMKIGMRVKAKFPAEGKPGRFVCLFIAV